MKEVQVQDIIHEMERFAPPHLAENWDPIGLSFGSKETTVKKVLIALDVDAHTIKEAESHEVDLILTHHPAIFKSLKTLNDEDSRRKEFIQLIQSDIAVYSAHTNIDAAEYGMNEWLADALNFPKEREIVSEVYEAAYKKIAVFVPKDSSETVRQAMHAAGAGEVGAYKDVSYDIAGTGHFTPQEGAEPNRGEINQQKSVDEVRIEMMFPEDKTSAILQSLVQAHPYEEPVFDLYTIENQKQTFGYGRIGTMNQTTEEMISSVKSAFNVDHLRYSSYDLSRKHKKVAIFGGSGEDYYKEAQRKGVTLFITGDVSYHGAQDMLRDGMDVIDPGHFIESIFISKMSEVLNTWKDSLEWDLEIIEASSQKDVFDFK